jgi:O-antigen ligase
MSYALAVIAVGLALLVRPRIADAEHRRLDFSLMAYVLLVGVQRVPLPPAIRLAVSPAVRAVDLRLRLDAPLLPMADTAHALSVHPEGTTLSLLVTVCVVLTFWSARTIFGGGGIRIAARAIAVFGMALAVFGMAQHVTAPHLFYWTWLNRNASPFGPFLNHSDFATWLVMALSLTAGYVIARVHSRAPGGMTLTASDAFDDTAMWLTTSAGLMAAGLVVGLSRSGLIAGGSSMLTLWMLSSRRMHARGRVWLLSGLAAVTAVAIAYANTTAVAGRIVETLNRGMGGRAAIWRATWPMVKDFWLTGVGAGAFERGMMVYQPSPHETYFNHAHNDYLQLLTEGGLLLAIPAILIAWAGIRQIRARLRADRSSMYWVRVGAVSGMVAVAVQSLWETGLRVPANTLLFAVLAAIALHSAPEPPRRAADDTMQVAERQ